MLSLLGLCYKAGRLAAGEVRCETAVRSGDAKLVLVTEDASKNTKKKFTNRCAYSSSHLDDVAFYENSFGESVGKGRAVMRRRL
ncbi:MAG: L7Ae/L30e/S12e/Gadd45 family ribosomal protein [Clostridia bacterium]